MINWELGIKVSVAISSDDVEDIKQLLEVNTYPKLRQEQKAEQIFSMVYNSFNSENKGEKILKYLIFDYNISEELARKAITHNFNPNGMMTIVKKMFDTRHFNKELNHDLPLSGNTKKILKL